MSQAALSPSQSRTDANPAQAGGAPSSGGARSELKGSLAGKGYDVQAKALTPRGGAPVQLMPARNVQRDEAAPTGPSTNQQTNLAGIDVARNAPAPGQQLGTPVDATTQASIDNPLLHPYFPVFKQRVVALFASGKVGAPPQPPETIAEQIWTQICASVKASMPQMDDPTTYSNFAKKWVDMTSPGFLTAVSQFQSICSQIAGFASAQFTNANSYGFWSKPEGRELGESVCDLTLETSGIGAIFDALPTLNGSGAGWDPQLWGALSHSYAVAVANAVATDGKRVHVCIGAYPPGGNIWEAVESKAMTKGLGELGLTLKDRVTYHGAAAVGKNDRKLDKAKTGHEFPGAVYSGPDRDAAIAAANAHYDALPEAAATR